MAYCGKCGTPVAGDFCRNCGARSNQAGGPVAPPAVPPPPPTQPITPVPPQETAGAPVMSDPTVSFATPEPEPVGFEPTPAAGSWSASPPALSAPPVQSALPPRRRSGGLVAVIVAGVLLLAAGGYAAAKVTILKDSTAGSAPTQAASSVQAKPTSIPIPSATASSASATSPVAVPVTPTPTPVAYNRQGNGRFGFTCNVPASFVVQQASANGDGFSYQGADGQAKITCFGSNNVSTSVRQAYEQELASLRSEGDSVTYQALVGNAITVSGISRSDGGVYYRRILWGPGSVDTLQWSYPRSLLGQLKAAVEHSAATFHPGDLASSH